MTEETKKGALLRPCPEQMAVDGCLRLTGAPPGEAVESPGLTRSPVCDGEPGTWSFSADE